MNALMPSQVTANTKRLATLTAIVRLLSSVDTLMSSQVTALTKRLPTLIALVRLLSCVNALMISQVNIVDAEDQVTSSCDAAYTAKGELSGCLIGVKKAEGTKCGRCWFYDREVGKHDRYGEDLCQRCDEAIHSWEEQSGSKFTTAALEEAPVS